MLGAIVAPGQIRIEGSGPGSAVRLANENLAVLEADTRREDLPCVVSPVHPFLGFDMRFHSGYDISIPLKELAGSRNTLTVLFRVTPRQPEAHAVYFLQKFLVPDIQPETSGNATLGGGFDLGEGEYDVDWLMRDRKGRVCSTQWDTKAELKGKDREIRLAIPAGTVQVAQTEQFQEEPPVAKEFGQPPLHVKVLVNFAPQDSTSSAMQKLESAALVAILRNVAREPHIGKYSLVAFNLQQRRVLHRQDNVPRIDFPALGRALDSLELGVVSLDNLMEKHGETQFLEELVQREADTTDIPDALVFIGPKAMLDENVPKDELRAIGQLDYPVFYLNFALDPTRSPWRDAIGHVVKFFKGFEYLISRPRDVWFDVQEMMTRIGEFRRDRQTGPISQ